MNLRTYVKPKVCLYNKILENIDKYKYIIIVTNQLDHTLFQEYLHKKINTIWATQLKYNEHKILYSGNNIYSLSINKDRGRLVLTRDLTIDANKNTISNNNCLTFYGDEYLSEIEDMG